MTSLRFLQRHRIKADANYDDVVSNTPDSLIIDFLLWGKWDWLGVRPVPAASLVWSVLCFMMAVLSPMHVYQY